MKKFEQLKRQYRSLSEYLDVTDLSDKNISATTADFDRLFELTWKTLKAYLYGELGMYEAKTGSPREILKLAAAQELLCDDLDWLLMLKDRNDDSHIYHKSDAIVYMSKIAGLLPSKNWAVNPVARKQNTGRKMGGCTDSRKHASVFI